MKQLYKIILYSSIAFLVITGLLLFIIRDRIIGFVHDQTNLIDSGATAAATLAPRETIDPEALKSKLFTSLTNNAVNFDFDNICWRPDTAADSLSLDPAETATGTELTSTTTEVVTPLGCRPGNDLPFIKKK